MESNGPQQARGLPEEIAGAKAGTRADLSAQEWQWLLILSGLFFGAGLTGLVPGWEDPVPALAFSAAVAGIAGGCGFREDVYGSSSATTPRRYGPPAGSARGTRRAR